MTHSQLLVTSLLEYAARCHSDQQVLSYEENGLLQRCTYRDLHKRAQLCASALKAMGVRSVMTANWHVSPFADRSERPASWSSDALHEFECAAVKAARSQPSPLTAASTWSVGKKSAILTSTACALQLPCTERALFKPLQLQQIASERSQRPQRVYMFIDRSHASMCSQSRCTRTIWRYLAGMGSWDSELFATPSIPGKRPRARFTL